MRPGRMLAGAAWAASAAGLWAGWMVLSRHGVQTSLDVWDINALRFGVAGLILLPFALRRGLGVARIGWPGALLIAAGAGAPYTLLAIGGFAFAPVTHGALIPGLMPLFTALIGAWILGEVLTRRRLLGLLLVLLGVACIGGRGWLVQSSGQWRGDLMFAIGALLWATHTVAVRRFRVDAWQATALVCVLSLAGYLPGYLLVFGGRLLEAPLADVLIQGFYQGALTSVAALWCYVRSIAHLGAAGAAVFAALVPALASLMAIPVLGELPGFLEWAGVALVTIGIAFAVGARLRLAA